MIKRLIYILLFLPLFVSGQNNFFWSHTGDFVNITTKNATNIGSTTATLGGDIIKFIGDTILDYGFIVNENIIPQKGEHLTYSWYGEPGSFPHSFSHEISNFDHATTYYVRAYATTNLKTYYGEVKSFITDN